MPGKKIITFLGLAIILSSLGIGGFFVYQSGLLNFQADPEIKPDKVKITNISQDRFTVSWITNKPTIGSIVYGKDGKLDQTQIDDSDQLTKESQNHKLHHITVTNLQAASSYNFKIKSGEKNTNFDDQGKPYSVKTGPTLGSPPASDLISGTVKQTNNKPATDAIIYITIPGVSPLSTQVKKDGSWLISLSSARNAQLTDFAKYDLSTTLEEIIVQGESTSSSVLTNTANDSPVPLITLNGEKYDFSKQSAPVANNPAKQATPQPAKESSASSTKTSPVGGSQVASQFPLEPLKNTTTGKTPKTPENFVEDEVAPVEVVILNPSRESEQITIARPEFFGTGPINQVITIKIGSVQTITGTAVVDSKGNWKYSPNQDLAVGSHSLEVKYLNSDGINKSVKRNFVIAASSRTGATTPAFEATPSATTRPRVSMPSTRSGVPITGSDLPTTFLLIIGIIFISSGFIWKKVSI